MSVLALPLVVLAAGGTGGHVFPAEALATALRERGFRLVLVTDRRGGAFGGALAELEVYRVRAAGMAGKSPTRRLASLTELAVGLVQAWRLIRRIAPEAAVGFGGYASLPTVLAASLARCKTIVHEQNAVLGRANRTLAPRVDRIATAFPKPARVPKGAAGKLVRTGMPVRPAFAAARSLPYPHCGADGAINLLVLGGSQGARVFSEVLPAAVGQLPTALRRRLSISQQCRPEDLDRVRVAYHELGASAELASFFTDVPERLAAAHLVIARAGASSVGEITAVGRPAILVPYPHATDDHQMANARAIEVLGGGWVMAEPTFTPAALAERLESLLAAPGTLRDAARCARAAGEPDAAKRLADLVVAVIGTGDGRKAA